MKKTEKKERNKHWKNYDLFYNYSKDSHTDLNNRLDYDSENGMF